MHLKMLDVEIPDNPTTQEMIEYLNDHYSYRGASFAHNVKIPNLHGITREETDHMLDVLGNDPWVLDIIYAEHLDASISPGYYIETQGRSGGYFVLVRNGDSCLWNDLDEEEAVMDAEYMFRIVKEFDIACEKACQLLRSF